jgi:hypothetical protein
MSPTLDLPLKTLPDLESNPHVKGSLTLDNYKYLGPAQITGEPPPILYSSVAMGIADALGVQRKHVYVESIDYEVKGTGGGRRSLEGFERRRLQTVALAITFYVFVTEEQEKQEMAEMVVDKVYDGSIQENLNTYDDLESVEVNESSVEVEGADTGWKRRVKKWWHLAKEHWATIGVFFGLAIVCVCFWRLIRRSGAGDKQKLIIGNERPSQDHNRMGLGAIYGNDNGML